MREVLNTLCQHQTISRAQANEVLTGIASGDYDPVVVSSFLTVFRMRNVTVDELLGFRDAMLELALRPKLSQEYTVDLCGTGGDGKDTFNISTLASFVAAGAGVKVTKHGNVGVSSLCGSSDVLSELGARFTADERILSEQLEKSHICYLHAPLFHPAMKNVAPIRKALGVRTFFNLLGPLVNPARPKAQLIGVFSLEIGRLFHYLMAEGGQEYYIVHSLDGYDEISLTGKWRVFGRTFDRLLSPRDIGMEALAPEALHGGDPQNAAKLFVAILSGKGTAAQNAAVTVNAAHAIQLGKKIESFPEALAMAVDSLKSGAAKSSFNSYVEVSRSFDG